MAEKLTIQRDQILWESVGFIIFRDDDGSLWRYMPSFQQKFPVTIMEKPVDTWDEV
jgi:hypothetical protein